MWESYCRRSDIEHFAKLCKGTLCWSMPRVRHPEQADRRTWLILAAYAQLRLVRGIDADRRSPWERPLPAPKPTPTRVLRSFVTLLPLVDTPADAPKSLGRPPGRPKGSLSGRAKRYLALKKAA